MATLQDLKTQIENVNALGKKNLIEKGVEISADATTYEIMQRIALVGEDFWDSYQQNGERTNYKYAFYGQGWNDTTFNPKYNITPVGDASSIFQNCKITNLKELLEKNNVTLDFSQVTYASYPLQYSTITHIGILDCRNMSNMGYILNNARGIISVDKIILKDDGTQTFGITAFAYAQVLNEIRFEGVIGQSINFAQSSLLSAESVQNIIDCLATVETQQTLTLHGTVHSKLTDEQKETILLKNWMVQ